MAGYFDGIFARIRVRRAKQTYKHFIKNTTIGTADIAKSECVSLSFAQRATGPLRKNTVDLGNSFGTRNANNTNSSPWCRGRSAYCIR